MSRPRFPLALATLLAVLSAAPSPLVGQEPPAAAAGVRGRISGKVVGKNGTAVAGAVVRVAHLRTGTSVRSAPTDGKGAFAVDAIPYGYVDLVVETSDGTFLASQVVNVPPDGRLNVTLALTRNEDLPQGWWAGRQPRAVPGTDVPAVGVATVQERGPGFLRSPKGIAILAGAGGLALLALAGGGGGGESPASPTSP
jgi:hypothetical protein